MQSVWTFLVYFWLLGSSYPQPPSLRTGLLQCVRITYLRSIWPCTTKANISNEHTHFHYHGTVDGHREVSDITIARHRIPEVYSEFRNAKRPGVYVSDVHFTKVFKLMLSYFLTFDINIFVHFQGREKRMSTWWPIHTPMSQTPFRHKKLDCASYKVLAIFAYKYPHFCYHVNRDRTGASMNETTVGRPYKSPVCYNN